LFEFVVPFTQGVVGHGEVAPVVVRITPLAGTDTGPAKHGVAAVQFK
jgi:hypothetical protein